MKKHLLFIGMLLIFMNSATIAATPPDAALCHPPLTIKSNDWILTSKTWGNGNVEETKSDPHSILKQFKADAIIIYNSLFPSSKRQQQLIACKENASPAGKVCRDKQALLELERQDFLKRLLLVLADAPLTYTEIDNDTDHLKEWPYPLAVALSHGQRVLFDIEDNGEAFYNLLLTGPSSKQPKIDQKRLMASHGIGSKLPVKEENLKGIKNVVKNIMGDHRGVNVAIGGLGQLDKDGREIAPEGYRYDPKTDKISPRHCYQR